MKLNKLFSIIAVLGAICLSLYCNAATEVSDPAVTMMAGVGVVPAIIRDPLSGNSIPVFTRAQKFLYEFLERRAQNQTKQVADIGGIVFDPITYYIRFQMNALSGRQKIVSQATQRIVGVSNFDQGYLPQFYNFCFDRISVRYISTNTPVVNPAVQAVSGYSSVGTAMPGALRNAELIISLNKNIIVETPVTDFISQAAITGGGLRDCDGGELQIPRVLEENQLVEIELNLASAQSFANTANFTEAVEVELHGVQARLRY
jgi:hypothetical protein